MPLLMPADFTLTPLFNATNMLGSNYLTSHRNSSMSTTSTNLYTTARSTLILERDYIAFHKPEILPTAWSSSNWTSQDTTNASPQPAYCAKNGIPSPSAPSLTILMSSYANQFWPKTELVAYITNQNCNTITIRWCCDGNPDMSMLPGMTTCVMFCNWKNLLCRLGHPKVIVNGNKTYTIK